VSAPTGADDPRLDEVYRQLMRVMDPEVGLSIVKMGLVYGLDVAGDVVTVTMTLTTPGCPLGRAMADGVRAVVRELAWVREVVVDVVWEPAWSPEMIR
jgi:metal-sulfur cluster biosynthetic enzyme